MIPTNLPRDIDRAIVPAAPEPSTKLALAEETRPSASFSMMVERSNSSALPAQLIQVEPAAFAEGRSGVADDATRSFAESSLFNTRATATSEERPAVGTIPPDLSCETLGAEARTALHDRAAPSSDMPIVMSPISSRSTGIGGSTLPTIGRQAVPIPRPLYSDAARPLPRTFSSQPTGCASPAPIKRMVPAQRTPSPVHIAIAAIENGLMIAARVDRASPDCADRLAQEVASIADELGIDIAAVTVNGRNAAAQTSRKR